MKIRNNRDGITVLNLAIVLLVLIVLITAMVVESVSSAKEEGFAKYSSTMISMQDLMNEKFSDLFGEMVVTKDERSEKEVYYMLATGKKINVASEVISSGKVESLGIISSQSIDGVNYYEITNEKLIKSIEKIGQYDKKQSYYITDSGEVFSLPGYNMSDKESSKWYVNSEKYYAK